MSDDYRAGDADGLTEAGMKHMLNWLHNYAEGQVTKKQDVVMCDLLAYEIERLRAELAGWENMRESYYHLEKLLAERDKRIEELETQNGMLLGEIARRSEAHTKEVDRG